MRSAKCGLQIHCLSFSLSSELLAINLWILKAVIVCTVCHMWQDKICYVVNNDSSL